MPGSWDYREPSLYRRRVQEPASSHLVGFYLPIGHPDTPALIPRPLWPLGLLFNSGQYNRSVLNPAIRVAPARSRCWGFRPNRTSEPGNFKPAILRNVKPTLTPKDKPEDAFSAPPGLTASCKMGRTGECAPPSSRRLGDDYLSGSQIAPPAARSRQTQRDRDWPRSGEGQERCEALLLIV